MVVFMDEKNQDKVVHTKYEKARMIGSRALQIAMGAPFLMKMEEADLEKLRYDPVQIAKKEYDAGIIPITVRRPLPIKVLIDKEGKKTEMKRNKGEKKKEG